MFKLLTSLLVAGRCVAAELKALVPFVTTFILNQLLFRRAGASMMSVKSFGEIIYSQERAPGEAITKVETHTPKIEAPEAVKALEPFEVKITVGPHPNEVQHSIRWIEVYFYEDGRPYNPIFISRVDLAPEYAEPSIKLTLRLKKSGVLYAIEYCNLHGVWEARKQIKVET